MKKALILIIAVILTGCGTARPVLYPNSKMQQAGEERAQQDIDECSQKAEAYVKENPAGEWRSGPQAAVSGDSSAGSFRPQSQAPSTNSLSSGACGGRATNRSDGNSGQ
jgi:hypothetical protein